MPTKTYVISLSYLMKIMGSHKTKNKKQKHNELAAQDIHSTIITLHIDVTAATI